MDSKFLSEIIAQMGWAMPYLLVYGTGLWISVCGKKSFPQIAKLCILSFLIFIFDVIFGQFFRVWRLLSMSSQNHGMTDGIIYKIWILSAFHAVLGICAWALILMALKKLFEKGRSGSN